MSLSFSRGLKGLADENARLQLVTAERNLDNKLDRSLVMFELITKDMDYKDKKN